MDLLYPFNIADLNPDWWMDISRTDKLDEISGIVAQVDSIVGSNIWIQPISALRSEILSGPNKRTVLLFDGIDDRYNTNISDDSTGGFELTAVATAPVSGSNRNIYQSTDGTGTGRAMLFIRPLGNAACFLGGIRLESTTLIDDNKFHLITFRYNSVTTLLRCVIDGLQENSGTRINNLATGNWLIGSNKTQNGDFFNGILAEGLKITGETSDKIFNAYQRHLCSKWSIEYKGPTL